MNKHKNKGRMKNRIVEGLALPKDLMLGASSLQILGNSEIYVENYLGITEYSCECIKVKIKEGIVEIQGSRLCICYYSGEEMKITGRIHSVLYCF